MSMTPLSSRSSTPPTPVTGLTIPSPGPHDKYKLIPLPPSPSVVERNLLEPETPVQDVDIYPSDIPLPPSPTIVKQALPFRRPRVSNVALSRVASSTQRTTSGRRVSSALQYAMHPHADADAEPGNESTEHDNSADIDLEYYQEMVNEAMSASDEEIEEFPAWDSSLGFGGQVPDLVNDSGIVGDADEAWMGYVRAQLNTLFPDYFDESGDGTEGDVSVSTIASSELATPPIGARLGPGLGVGRGVPNIRTEIGGLTEEIERLRGVVSGLADGMRAAQTATENVSSPVEIGHVTAPDVLPRPEASEAFLQVSPTSGIHANIRQLTSRCRLSDWYIQV